MYPMIRGFPQGANVSPFLSVCLLNLLRLPRDCNIIMYADDGLIYSDRDFGVASIEAAFEAIGQSLALEKSGWVKRSGGWLTALKFLGLRYEGRVKPPVLEASTRNGASLRYDKHDLVKVLESPKPFLVPYPVEFKSEVPFDSYGLWDGLGGWVECSSLKDAREKLLVLSAGQFSVQWRVVRLSAEGLMISENLDSHDSWESLVRSRIFGLIVSRMQSDS